MITLSDIRRALEQALTHEDNPALLRLPESERTVEGLARAYLPRDLWCRWSATEPGVKRRHTVFALEHVLYSDDPEFDEPYALPDLSDPGTCHAVLVVLALALGLDPGVGGLAIRWTRFFTAWQLETSDRFYLFMPPIRSGDDALGCGAPAVASEPDPIKALALALLHVCPRESP